MELNEKMRKVTPQEEKLLEELIKNASVQISSNWKNDLLVCPMDDGGMGSLYLYPMGTLHEKRSFSSQVSECQFRDRDGVVVIVSLNVDERGNIYELDIWKTDFSPLIELPSSYESVDYV